MAADQSTSRSAFTISSVVRGYHVYKDIWNAAQGEVLPCGSERSNLHDPFAVVKFSWILLPMKISENLSTTEITTFMVYEVQLVIHIVGVGQ